MKYKLFRSPGDLDKAVRKHELVAVETGKSIDDVADALIRAVRDDLAEMPEYAHCETAAYAPEPIKSFRRVRRYRYEMMGIVPFPVSWTVKMKKKQKETQDILSYHSQAAGCSDKARAKASGGRQPIEECGRTGL